MVVPYKSSTWAISAVFTLDLLFAYDLIPTSVADCEYSCGCKIRQEKYIIGEDEVYMEWKTDCNSNIEVGIARETIFGEVEVLSPTTLRAYLDFHSPTEH